MENNLYYYGIKIRDVGGMGFKWLDIVENFRLFIVYRCFLYFVK